MKEYLCEKCGLKFDNFQAKANHVRWNHMDNSDFSSKIKEANLKIIEEKLGKFINENIKCHNKKCGKIIEITYREKRKKEKYYCSRGCANSRGPMSEDMKNKISKKLKKESEIKKCLFCNDNFSIKRNKKQNFCSSECKNKFNFNQNYSIQTYRGRASFNFNLADYPEEFDFSIIEKNGWYRASNNGNNLNGVSRDHMISIKFGFDNKIDPKIIGHPANCRLMIHNDNSSKKSKCSINLEELLERIKEWDFKYKGGLV